MGEAGIKINFESADSGLTTALLGGNNTALAATGITKAVYPVSSFSWISFLEHEAAESFSLKRSLYLSAVLPPFGGE